MINQSIAINRAQYNRLSTDHNGAIFLSIADTKITSVFKSIKKHNKIFLHTREKSPRSLTAKITWAEIADSPFDDTSKKRFVFCMLKEVQNV